MKTKTILVLTLDGYRTFEGVTNYGTDQNGNLFVKIDDKEVAGYNSNYWYSVEVVPDDDE